MADDDTEVMHELRGPEKEHMDSVTKYLRGIADAVENSPRSIYADDIPGTVGGRQALIENLLEQILMLMRIDNPELITPEGELINDDDGLELFRVNVPLGDSKQALKHYVGQVFENAVLNGLAQGTFDFDIPKEGKTHRAVANYLLAHATLLSLNGSRGRWELVPGAERD
jgi:hypothetical protein